MRIVRKRWNTNPKNYKDKYVGKNKKIHKRVLKCGGFRRLCIIIQVNHNTVEKGQVRSIFLVSLKYDTKKVWLQLQTFIRG